MTIYVDNTHLGRHVTGLERITLELFSEAALAPLDVVPVKAQGAPSVAQNVQSDGGGVVEAARVAHCFGVSGAGSPNTSFVQGVPSVNVLTKNEPFAP